MFMDLLWIIWLSPIYWYVAGWKFTNMENDDQSLTCHEISENPAFGSEIHRCTGSIESLIGQIAEFGALEPNQKSSWDRCG